MKLRLIFSLLLAASVVSMDAQSGTDAYIKLNDSHGKHPRVMSVTFPGNADNLDMYNSLYGHGAVVENPWVAYRVYMDNRQSLDLYVKQTPRLELDVTGFYTTPGQLEQGYGCDVLWAGKSVAAGSFRGWRGGPLTIDTVSSRTQTVVSPSCVEVRDYGWIFNGHAIDMVQRYSVDSVSPVLDVEIKLSGYDADDLFCTGIQRLESNPVGFISSSGVAASWGDNVPDKARPEQVETVGLGIQVYPANIVKACEDELNYIFVVRPDDHGVIRYRVFATSTRLKEGAPASAEEWFGMILNEVKTEYK